MLETFEQIPATCPHYLYHSLCWGFLHIPSKRFNPDPRKYRLTPGLAPELPIQD